MGDMIRLDKYLADMSVGTRSTVKTMIAKGRVKVDGVTVKDASVKINKNSAVVEADGKRLAYAEYEYYMLNKPSGVVSATTDKNERTVLDIIETKSRKDLFPVGRLDKDTEGLLLITNDGGLSHRLLSPQKHVDKTYYVETDRPIDENACTMLRNGVDIGDDKPTLPATLDVCRNGGKETYLLTIHEGRFHQVKRMFHAAGAEVTYLKRISMGNLKLDSSLNTGEYRPLTKDELKAICGGERA